MDLFRPKKSLGQHFLIDTNVARKIVKLADVSSGDLVVEIGPGKGILTQILLERGARVLAIEVDPTLADALTSRLTPHPSSSDARFKLVSGDALRYPYGTIEGPFKVVANLPYNISTPILFRLLEERATRSARGHLVEMVLMVQKEVADRLAAPVGSKNYGVLSVLFQSLAEVKIAFVVSPNCFRPRPKVDSSVIKATLSHTPNVSIKNESFFAEVVKGGFSHRRKFLLNALTDAGFSRDPLFKTLEKIGIDPHRRAETLSLVDFAALANGLFDLLWE